MNLFKKIGISIFALTALFASSVAFAATPSLYLGSSSDGDTVPVTVNGDPNANVLFLYSTSLGAGTHLMPLGTTNASGYLSAMLSTSQYKIIPGSGASVSVNGAVSTQVAWPSLGASAGSSVSLSQTSLSLVTGAQAYVAINNASGSVLFISNNSNSSVASASMSGSQILVAANSSNISGSTVITVCYQSNASNCGSLYVTVSGNSSATTSSTLSFNQNNISLNEGQTLTVLMTGSGGYVLADTSNTSIARASVSGNALIVTGYTFGSATIKVCESDGQCGTLYVTVSLPGSTISFDQQSVTLSVGQSLTVNARGGSGYYVSSNSNTSAASASVSSGSSILLFANNPGTTSVTVCGSSSSSSQCGVINVTVTGATSGTTASTNTPTTFSQTNITLSGAGQSQTVQAYGGSSYAISSNSNSSVVSAAISGSAITVTAVNPGTASITVCQNGVLCGTFFVTVSGATSGTVSGVNFSPSFVSLGAGTNQLVTINGGSGSFSISSNTNPSVASASLSGTGVIVSAINPGTTNVTICIQGTSVCGTLSVNVGSASVQALTLNPASLALTLGQGQPVQIYGSGSYYVSNNTVPSVASAIVSGNGIIVTALAYGSTSITVCQNGAQCGTLPVIVSPQQALPVVSPANPVSILTTSPSASVSPASGHIFSVALRLGSVGAEVRALQSKLKSLGYYSYAITGTYGPVTEAAVKKFQKAHKLPQLGSVGPGTRSALNSR